MIRSFRFLALFILLFRVAAAQQPDSLIYDEDGKASYYAKKFHGRRTASGEIFNNSDYTAAHRTLPFNTYLNVINESNKYNVIVRVNDRGPFSKNRIIDLSEAAARRIGGYQKGLVHVRIKELNLIHYTPELEKKFNSGKIVDCYGNPAFPAGETLSLWSTTDLVHAVYVANDLFLKETTAKIYIGHKKVNGVMKYYVLVGEIPDKKEAALVKDAFEKKGFMKVVRYEP